MQFKANIILCAKIIENHEREGEGEKEGEGEGEEN